MEKFEVTDEDFQDAFDPTARKRRKFTKDDAIYGMWAEGNDSEDDSRPSFGRKKQTADYTAPLSFVAGGVKEGSSEKGKKRTTADVPPDEGDEVNIVSSTTRTSKADSKRPSGKAKTFAGLGMEKDKDFGKWEKNTKGIGLKLMGKMGYKVGQGLGKEGEGITKPIEVTLRKGKGAIGAYGSERIRDPRDPSDPQGPQGVEGGFEKQKRNVVQQKTQWRKKEGGGAGEGGEGQGGVRYRFRTVEEVLEEKDGQEAGGWDTSQLSKVKVIDMTGKETRVLSGYHAIHTQREGGGEEEGGVSRVFDVAELRHNLDLLIEMSEKRILESNKKLEYEKSLAFSLEEERTLLVEKKEKNDFQVGRLNVALDLIDRLIGSQDTMGLEECLAIFNDLYDHHLEDYRAFEFDQLAAAIVSPIMMKFFQHWDPLSHPTYGHQECLQWRRLLQPPHPLHPLQPPQRSFETSRNTPNPFHTLLWDVWMPFVRQAILRWSPKVFVRPNIEDPILKLVTVWQKDLLLPQWMEDFLLEKLVLPRLLSETEVWDPTTDPVPIHHWIHPWAPLLGERLEVVYGVVRGKLGGALGAWHPSDRSARLMLQPWIDVFSQATLEQFLVRSILPKLQEVMEAMVVNPRAQVLDPWHWTMEWSELMPVSSMAALLERHFFPKWLRVLNLWLSNSPDMEEIPNWYSGWKTMLPEKLRSHPTVQEQLNVALAAMSNALDDEEEESVPAPPPPHLHPVHPVRPQPPLPPLPTSRKAPPPPPQAPPPSGQGVTLGYINSAPTFKDVVGRRAEDLGVLFMPLVGRNFQGKQVFKFGGVTISIDRDVIFVQRGANWVPTGLDELSRVAV